jgi:hypothetical protein
MPKEKKDFIEMQIDLNSFLTPSEIKDMEQMAKDANMELADFIVYIIEGYVTQLGSMDPCECQECECEKEVVVPKKKKSAKEDPLKEFKKTKKTKSTLKAKKVKKEKK